MKEEQAIEVKCQLNRKDTKVAKRLNFTEVSTHGK